MRKLILFIVAALLLAVCTHTAKAQFNTTSHNGITWVWYSITGNLGVDMGFRGGINDSTRYAPYNASFRAGSFGLNKGTIINTPANRGAIPSPLQGMVAFDTTAKAFYGYNGLSWVRFDSTGGGGVTQQALDDTAADIRASIPAPTAGYDTTYLYTKFDSLVRYDDSNTVYVTPSQLNDSLNTKIDYPTNPAIPTYVLALNGSGIPEWTAPSGGGTPTLDDVTTAGNVTSNVITVSEVNGNTRGQAVRLTNTNNNFSNLLFAPATTFNRQTTFPNATGTVLLENNTATITNKAIDASQLTGTVAIERLPGNIDRTYASDTIDGTVTGDYPIFTTVSNKGRFIITGIRVWVISNVGGSVSGLYNIGWTATDYDDILSGIELERQIQSTYQGTVNDLSFTPSIAPLTQVFANITQGVTATTFDVKFEITGHYENP